jgi:hypothetical protein
VAGFREHLVPAMILSLSSRSSLKEMELISHRDFLMICSHLFLILMLEEAIPERMLNVFIMHFALAFLSMLEVDNVT